jgi:antitoxin ParD1/3/4
MPTRKVNLTPELDHFVASKVKAGLYGNASEVMQAALRSLERDEREREQKMAALRAAIDEGIASGVAEPGVFARVRGRHGRPARQAEWCAYLDSGSVASDAFMEGIEDLPEALASVQHALRESAEGKSAYRGSFAKYAQEW